MATKLPLVLTDGEIQRLQSGDVLVGGVVARTYRAPIVTSTVLAFVNYLTLTLPALEAGTYEVEVTYGWNMDRTNRSFRSRILFDGVQLGEEHSQEPKEAGGTDPTGTTQRYYLSRKVQTTVGAALPAGSTIDVEFRPTTQGTATTEASMWECTIIMREV